MSNKPTYSRSRKGSLNRSSVTVRLALSAMKFDGVVEWVKTFRQLEKLLEESNDTSEKLSIINTKFNNLKELFSHVYPKLKEMDLVAEDLIEMEAVLDEESPKRVEEVSTEDLISQLTESK